MNVAATYSNIQSIQNVFQTVATTLAMTAYLFPPQANISDGDVFDYIVVGSGSGGGVVASRLSEDPKVTVLLVEAGGDPPLESVLPAYMTYLKNTKVDWNYTSERDGTQEAHHYGITDVTRGKMLGGSSSLNWMFYIRGNPENYNSWAKVVKDHSWNYSNVLPYFIKSEHLHDAVILNSPSGVFHGTKGNIGVTTQKPETVQKYLDAFAEVGYDIVLDTNSNQTLGFQHRSMLNIAHGARQSTAYSYLGPAKDRPNLYVAKNTLVTKVLFDENKNAVAIEAVTESGQKIKLKANKEIILSAGTINTPQILMLSGVGPRNHLEDMNIKVIVDLPVGKNFQDHNCVVLMYPTENAPPIKPINPHNSPLPVIYGFVAMNKSQNYPDYEPQMIVCDDQSILTLCFFSFSFKNELCEHFYKGFKDKESLFVCVTPMHGESRGRVTLRSTDPLDQPKIHLGIYSEKQDLDDVVSYIQDFDRVTTSNYFQSFNSTALIPPQCKDFEFGSEEYWRCHAKTMVTSLFHYVGTCAMGSVVDSRLRVYGVNRLRIADASIMPTITSGNPNAPIMMIGEKAADMIKQDNA